MDQDEAFEVRKIKEIVGDNLVFEEPLKHPHAYHRARDRCSAARGERSLEPSPFWDKAAGLYGSRHNLAHYFEWEGRACRPGR